MRVCPRCRAIYATRVQWCGLDNTALVEQSRDPWIGQVLDRYEIIEALGFGGMGVVYRAKHSVIDREYAIKVMFGDYSADPKFVERFRREAQTMSRIRHPNIVSVEDFGTTTDGLSFLVMEYVRGHTLESLIKREAPLSPDHSKQIMRQILLGLEAAHREGYVHRDVKPGNVMLSPDEDGVRIKILDFGAARLRALPAADRLTNAGHIIGTPTYMAPEQSQDPSVGPTADLYACGVLLYEMLTGAPPFVGRGRAEIMIMHIMDAPPQLPPIGGLEMLVARLLEKRPQDRPGSARAAINVLDDAGSAAALPPVPRPGTPTVMPAGLAATQSADSAAAAAENHAPTPVENLATAPVENEAPTPREKTGPKFMDAFSALGEPDTASDFPDWALDGTLDFPAAESTLKQPHPSAAAKVIGREPSSDASIETLETEEAPDAAEISESSAWGGESEGSYQLVSPVVNSDGRLAEPERQGAIPTNTGHDDGPTQLDYRISAEDSGDMLIAPLQPSPVSPAVELVTGDTKIDTTADLPPGAKRPNHAPADTLVDVDAERALTQPAEPIDNSATQIDSDNLRTSIRIGDPTSPPSPVSQDDGRDTHLIFDESHMVAVSTPPDPTPSLRHLTASPTPDTVALLSSPATPTRAAVQVQESRPRGALASFLPGLLIVLVLVAIALATALVVQELQATSEATAPTTVVDPE